MQPLPQRANALVRFRSETDDTRVIEHRVGFDAIQHPLRHGILE
jgi:hypothetical protein